MELFEASSFDCVHNFLNVLLETQVEHLIGFVENSKLEACEIKVSPFHMIDHPTTSSDENVNAPSQLVSLIFNVSAAINGEHVVFSIVLLEGV